jgi:hypothetical protein
MLHSQREKRRQHIAQPYIVDGAEGTLVEPLVVVPLLVEQHVRVCKQSKSGADPAHVVEEKENRFKPVGSAAWQSS